MKDVLILSDAYLPINIVNMKKACKMLVKSSIFDTIGRKSEYHVEILEFYDDYIKTGSIHTPRPAVIKISHYSRSSNNSRKSKVFAPFSRIAVWKRDHETCQYCGDRVRLEDMHWDHVIPRKLGGKSSWTNIVCACLRCNSKKADRLLDSIGMKLLKNPEVVYNETTPALAARERILRRIGKNIPSQWIQYLEWIGIAKGRKHEH